MNIFNFKLLRVKGKGSQVFTNTFLFFIFMAIMAIPLSITISQGSIVLSLLFGVFYLRQIKKLKLFESIKEIPLLFKIGFLFISLSYINDVIKFFMYGDIHNQSWRHLMIFKKTDIILLFFSILIWKLYNMNDLKIKKVIDRAYFSSAIIILLSGIASIFTKHRLYYFLKSTPHYSPLQNKLFSVGNISIYSPQGFLSNRLTFAGIIILVFPFFLFKAYEHFSSKSILSILRSFAFSLFPFVILWLTGVRSSLIGVFLTLPILILALKHYNQFNHIKNPTPPFMKYFFSLKNIKHLFASILLLCMSFYFVPAMYWENIFFKPLLRLSDFGRAFMWSEAGTFISQYFWTGIGYSNFESFNAFFRDSFLFKHPDTWYFLQFIPLGHLHSDILDSAVKNGMIITFFYLLLFFLLVQKLFLKSEKLELCSIFLILGGVSIFIAGFAQCYFIDEEVATLFWINLALSIKQDN